MTNLTSLELQNNEIVDLVPLQHLPKLTSLFVYGNRISDLTPLEPMANLRYLHIGYNPITISDVTPLQSLTNLEVLLLSIDQVGDWDTLESDYQEWQMALPHVAIHIE